MLGNNVYIGPDQYWEVSINGRIIFELSKGAIPHLSNDPVRAKEDCVEPIFRTIFGRDDITAKRADHFAIAETVEMKILVADYDAEENGVIAFVKKGRIAVVPRKKLSNEEQEELLVFFAT